MATNRPTGVTIICIIGFIGAILEILGGAAMAAFGSLIAAMITWDPAVLMGIGVITLIIGIITLVALYWLWKMLKKGWTIVMVLEIIGLILSAAMFNIIGIIIALIIIIYLWIKKDLFIAK